MLGSTADKTSGWPLRGAPGSKSLPGSDLLTLWEMVPLLPDRPASIWEWTTSSSSLLPMPVR